MQPRTLEYFTPPATSFDWRPLLHVFILGPFTGAAVGFAQTTAAVLCWMLHGEPDFYFRDWPDVDMSYMMLTVGGGIVGAAYGLALWTLERFTRRRIRVLLAAPIVVVLAIAVAAVIVEVEFRRQKIGWVFAPQTIAIVIGVLVSAAASRRAP